MSSKVTKVEEVFNGPVREERMEDCEKQLETVSNSEKQLPKLVKCPFGRGRIIDKYC
jgi:hypothetical protein